MKKGSGSFWYTDSNGKRKRRAGAYKREYEKFQSSESDKKDRASRNSARRAAIKRGTVKVHDGKVIDHQNSNPRDNSSSNLRVMSKSENAGRRENSRKRGSSRNRRTWGK